MSSTEVKRAGILNRVQQGEIPLARAAVVLKVSYRQAKRLYKRYRERGSDGLVHGNTGRRSNRAKDAKLRRKVMELIRKNYAGGPGERFGPTLVSEQLAEDHGIRLDAETVRRWMLGEGLWSKERKRKAYRQRRVRRSHFGELVQMDGSFEDWLEGRGERGCLINMVDDATSTGLARFFKEETTWAVAETLRAWVEQYGIPRALYVDWKNVYHHRPTEKQKEAGVEEMSQFQRMCQRLGIELIGANSPQAKGRVERSHGVHQDRLIKKMRLKKIVDYTKANEFLREQYLPQHNARYAVKAGHEVDFHEAVPKGIDLDDVFCLEYERSVSNDWVVQYQGRWFQIEPDQPVRAGQKVIVRERRDGSLKILGSGQPVRWRELTTAPGPKPVMSRPTKVPAKTKPAADHPWRKAVVERSRSLQC